VKVGFIGLGNMGAPMARRLLANGHDVKVFDSNAALAQTFSPAWVGSLREAGSDRDAIVTMLPNGQIVREVLLGEHGALSHARPGTIVLDTSSSDAAGTVALGAELKRLGFALIDAPVSGGVPLAAQGKLAMMIGSDDRATLDRVRPALEAFGDRPIEVGGLGCGHAAKAINNAIAAAIVAITSEGLVLGERFGIAPGTLLDVINSATGRSQISETIFKTQILPRTFALGFSIGLMAKDVALAASLCNRLGLDLPVLDAVSTRWSAARDALGHNTDFTAFVRDIEARNGVAKTA
jgi:3-hydroxyisobutyrate dehydrogenase